MDYVEKTEQIDDLFSEISTIQESRETLRHDGDVTNAVSIKLLRMHQVINARRIIHLIDKIKGEPNET